MGNWRPSEIAPSVGDHIRSSIFGRWDGVNQSNNNSTSYVLNMRAFLFYCRSRLNDKDKGVGGLQIAILLCNDRPMVNNMDKHG